MTGGKSRWLGFALVAGASAGLLLLTSMMNSAFAYGDTAAITGDYAGVPVEVMGASGLPNPLTQPGSSPRNVTRAREIATRMSKPAESVTTAADRLEETASRRGFG